MRTGDGNDNTYDCDYVWQQWQPRQRKQEQLLMKNHRNNSNRNRCLKRKKKQRSCIDKTHIEKKTTILNVFTWTRIVSVLKRYLQCIGNGDYLIALYISCWMLKIGQRRRRYRFPVYILVIIPWIADEKHFIKLTKCVMCKESVLHHSFSSLCSMCVCFSRSLSVSICQGTFYIRIMENKASHTQTYVTTVIAQT